MADDWVTGIGQTAALLKARGSTADGTIYAAVRTSGPYGSGEHDAIRNGTGAAWHASAPNGLIVSFFVSALTPGTAYYYGVFEAAGSDGPVRTGSFVTTAASPEASDGLDAPKLIE